MTFLRFAGISVVNVIVGQTLLFLFSQVLGWSAFTANVAAVCLSAIPAYLMSRSWVWKQTGRNRWMAEVAPFWGLTLLGLLLSTLAVTAADRQFDNAFALNAASLTAFAGVWLSKFFIFERIIWAAPATQADDRPVPAAEISTEMATEIAA